MLAERLSPPGLLTIDNAPQLSVVRMTFRLGRISEDRPRDGIRMTSNNWELRAAHFLEISWSQLCIESFIADGTQQLNPERCQQKKLQF